MRFIQCKGVWKQQMWSKPVTQVSSTAHRGAAKWRENSCCFLVGVYIRFGGALLWRSTPLEELCLLQLILEDQEIHTVRLQRKTPGRKQQQKVVLWTGSRRKSCLFSNWQQGTIQLNLALQDCHSWPPSCTHTNFKNNCAPDNAHTSKMHLNSEVSALSLKMNGCYWFPHAYSSLLSKHSKK